VTHSVWNRSCVANWYEQLSENRFHWEQVKHLIIRSTFINDTGTAGQEPLCAKHIKLEQLDLFRHIQHHDILAPGGPTAQTQKVCAGIKRKTRAELGNTTLY
jgi:hypothetical protein